ncbi:hypothetical protein SAMN05444170_7382 [Bradyrhizobium erythrophlei]|uniref:Uncharacterized protein n=1 Tax=Bradyrhizobium erythrophlei TaxID=1437360 RepID=A0A1M7UY05_9BRAD|nr:hypothetical protein SAMN05444170_7382 [Bradyrhizobium erythrophlei]
MKVAFRRTAIASLIVPCVTLLSFSGSGRLGVERAQGADRPLTPYTDARGARRPHLRSDRGYGLFATAVAATTSPWNYDDYYCWGSPPGSHYYSSYPGGYCVRRNYVTGLYGHPTLFPRYYSASGW